MGRCLAILTLCALNVPAQGADLSEAARLYQRTQYEEAIRVVASLPGGNAEALLLAGKARYGLEEYRQASELFEKALEADPGNSSYWNWLGRAFGRRAETSSFLTAPRYAIRCRDAFEKAVELDSGNIEAMSDLFSYYLDAPGFLGGGVDKASALAEKAGAIDKAQFEYLQAQLALKRKDRGAAGEHYRRAVELEPDSVGRILDLAGFLAEQGQWDEADSLFDRALGIEPDAPRIAFARAQAYIGGGREQETARRLLREYLAAELTPDDPPRRQAERLLNKIGAGG
jgi:tetratricopeptide (TPR) repeat protein